MSEGGLNIKLYKNQWEALTTEATAVLFGGQVGGGKLLILNTLIPTVDKGFVTMRDLQVGDKVFDKDGNPCNVVAKSEVDYSEQAYEITFETGEVIIAGGNHEWLALECSNRSENYKRSDEYRAKRRANRPSRAVSNDLRSQLLRERNAREAEEKRKADALLKPEFGKLVNTERMFQTQHKLTDSCSTGSTPNWSISVAQATKYRETNVLLDPYLLGVWLGDGSANAPSITNGDREIVDYLVTNHNCSERDVVKVKQDGENGELHWVLYIRDVKDAFRTYNLLNNKHIPDAYMYGSIETRLRVLNGIMDTDGYIEKNNAYLSFSSERLINQTRELACSLGIKCSKLRSRKPFYISGDGKRVYCKTSYILALHSQFNPFTLSRKKDLWDRHVSTRLKNNYYRLITSIKPVENTGMQCIQVDSPDHTYCITESYIPTHNSYLIRAAAIIYAIEIPGAAIYIFRKNYGDLMANHVNSNQGFVTMLSSMIQDKLVKFNRSEYRFEFTNGSSIQLAHLNNESDLGAFLGRELTILIIDEATQIDSKSIQFLISRLRLGGLSIPDKWKGKVPRALFCTNPGGVSHNYFKERFVDLGPGIHQMPPELGGMKHIFIPARLEDNKVLMENDPDYRNKVLALGIDNPELCRAMLEGDWEISDSAAIANWKRDIHVINPFRIPSTWKIYRSYDYGFSAPYSVLWGAISNGEDYIDDEGNYCSAPKDSIFIIAEIYGATPENKGLKEQPSETAKRVKEMDESLQALGYKIYPGPADNSIFNKDRGNSIAKIFSDNGVQWVRSNKNPGSRVLGLQIVNQMVYNALLPTPEGPIFKVFKTCPFLAKQLPALPRDKLKMEDVDTNANDHSWDSTRYLCLHINNLMQTKQVTGL